MFLMSNEVISLWWWCESADITLTVVLFLFTKACTVDYSALQKELTSQHCNTWGQICVQMQIIWFNKYADIFFRKSEWLQSEKVYIIIHSIHALVCQFWHYCQGNHSVIVVAKILDLYVQCLHHLHEVTWPLTWPSLAPPLVRGREMSNTSPMRRKRLLRTLHTSGLTCNN